MQRTIFNPAKTYETFTTTNTTINTTTNEAETNIAWKIRVNMARYLSFIHDDLKRFEGQDRLAISVNSDTKDSNLYRLEILAIYRKSDTSAANESLDVAIRNLFSLLNKHSGLTTKDYVELVKAHEDFLKSNDIQSNYHAKVAKQHGSNYRPHGNAY